MQPKISIVVPVYNVEQYLHRCINSILVQTFTDFELILIDDGSTDKSSTICDQYAVLDNRIRVIHKENRGVSAARNDGIDASRGEYIAFVDSDDFIHERMYEILYGETLLNNSEIVVCEYINVEAGTEPDSNYRNNISAEIKTQQFTNIQALNLLYGHQHVTFVVPWNKLYKISLFDKYRYKEGRIYEDEFIAHKLLFLSTNITYVPYQLYYYYQRSGSLIRSPFTIDKFDKLSALNDRADFLRKVNQIPLYHKTIKIFMELFFWNYLKAKEELDIDKQELRKLKKVFDSKLLSLIKNPLIGWKQKTMTIVFYFNPSLFILLSENIGKR